MAHDSQVQKLLDRMADLIRELGEVQRQLCSLTSGIGEQPSISLGDGLDGECLPPDHVSQGDQSK